MGIPEFAALALLPPVPCILVAAIGRAGKSVASVVHSGELRVGANYGGGRAEVFMVTCIL